MNQSSRSDEKRTLTLDDVSIALGISYEGARRLVASGRIAAARTPHKYLVSREALDQFIGEPAANLRAVRSAALADARRDAASGQIEDNPVYKETYEKAYRRWVELAANERAAEDAVADRSRSPIDASQIFEEAC